MTDDRHVLLRQALWFDAFASGAMGVLLCAASGMLTDILGLPRALLIGSGVICLAYAVAIAVLARKARIPRAAAFSVVAGNGLWVAASVWLLVSGLVSPTPAGQGFVLVQAAAVLGLAALQWRGLSRLGATMAA
jgi:hypothetical protein